MINELILWIAELPNIVRVMFLGAVLGGIGGVLGATMLRNWPPARILLPAAFAAATLPINNSLITPFFDTHGIQGRIHERSRRSSKTD